MNSYPESLHDRCTYLEVVADEGMPSWNTHSWQQVFFFEGKWFGTNAEWDFQMHITDGFKGAYVSLLKDHGGFICEGTFDGDWKKSLMKRPIIKQQKEINNGRL